MQQKNILLFVLLLLLSCKPEPKQEENKDIKTEEEATSTALNEKEETPESVAFHFYKEYLKNIYLKKSVETPEIVLNKDSIYVLDSKAHLKFIKESGCFSKLFYENEESTIRNCEKQLRKVKWKEVEESGAVNPAEFVEGNECGFTSYMVWTNGQGEVINKVDYDNSNTKGNKAYVSLKLSDSLGGGFYSKPKVTLIKEEGSWKILKINVGTE